MGVSPAAQHCGSEGGARTPKDLHTRKRGGVSKRAWTVVLGFCVTYHLFIDGTMLGATTIIGHDVSTESLT